MVKKFMEEESPSKKMQAMLFRASMPIIWRNLDVRSRLNNK
jgi:hypothetical protein